MKTRRPAPRPRSRAANDDDVRTGLSVKALQRALYENLFYGQARFPAVATRNDCYLALAHAVRDRLLQHWVKSAQTYFETQARTVCYFSAEYLLGPQFASNLLNLGIADHVRQATAAAGLDLDGLIAQEEEPGLGNGGLGRLAACYLDSLATLEIPAIGYGIRYEFGIFDQEIRDGWQVEVTDKWLRLGNPWEMARPEVSFAVKLGGHTEAYTDAAGRFRVRWLPERVVRGTPYDTPILGYRVNTANLLRLWKAEACESFDFRAFNTGDYYGAVNEKIVSENITKILYPNDELPQGKRLRLQQQYFFVSCSLQDMLRLYQQRQRPLTEFHRKYAVQLNDTHPALAVAELLRLLVDEHGLEWDGAWDVVQQTFGYTNHTLLPEALEKWPVELFGSVLPRHLEIIYEINRRFLDSVRARGVTDEGRLARLSLIDESGPRYVRMANLACVGSHAINGVARLHTELLQRDVLGDFHALWPEKFSSQTNGVTPRRFVALANPRLSALITEALGSERWLRHLDELRRLEPRAAAAGFRAAWRRLKRANKCDLAAVIQKRTGVVVDPDSLFDIQAKRLHEYKRQHLNLLHVITLYHRLRQNPHADFVPRTVIFAGKAAPGYFLAKLIIKLINSVAAVVNADPAVRGRLKVVFLPDFNVKHAQSIYPAAELSEQISTAGKEASGTGNMKFALNGALTIGTLDGANVEIREQVGPENFFLFGLTADQVAARRAGGYRPWEHCEADPELKAAIELLRNGHFANGDTALFRPLVDGLLSDDPYMLLADYRSYVDTQDRVSQTYRQPDAWTRLSIQTVARMGYFSSDRAIQKYCDEIWHVKPVHITLADRPAAASCRLPGWAKEG